MWCVPALVGLALMLASPAQATHVRCGDTLTQDTTLDSDLVDCPGDGVTATPGVSLDLAGHMIDGTDTGAGVRALDGVVRVHDGTVRQFGAGLETDEARFVLRGLRILSNGTGVSAYGGGAELRDSLVAGNQTGTWETSPILNSRFTGNRDVAIIMSEGVGTIADNVVAHNGGGIFVGEGDGTVARNRVTDNRLGISWRFSGEGAIRDNFVARNGAGISTGTFASPAVTGNVVTRNAAYGIRGDWSDRVGSEIAGNVVSRNGGDGIVVTGDGHCALVEQNTVSENGENGVLVTDDGADASTCVERVAGNEATRNGLDGIRVVDNRGPVLLERNRTHRNGDDGIDVDPVRLELFAPAWSPDGDRIAFTVVAGPHLSLFATGLEGGHPTALTSFGARPVWSPDGARLAFDFHGDLYVTRVNAEPLRLAAGADPAWSPDGSTIAFARGDAIYVVPASGGEPRLLGHGSGPRWSPDGEAILFGWNSEVFTIAPGGGAPHRVASGFSGAWSPDGQQIVFASRFGHLAIVNRDGTGERQLTGGPDEDSSPAWSPDGEWIAFRRLSLTNGAYGDSFYAIRPDGTGLKRLVTPEVLNVNGMAQPRWSPDSETIAFEARGLIWSVRVDSPAPAAIPVALDFNPLVTLTGNRADRNADLGIEAVEGVVDGGGNRARHNGDPRQCLSVSGERRRREAQDFRKGEALNALCG